VLLATLAALANDEREVLGLTTDEVCSAAGVSDRTYRRARAALLASGELVAESCAGGRGNTNRWRLADPRDLGAPLPARQRVAPTRNARPLLAAATPAVQDAENPGQDRTVSGVNPGQDRTLSSLNPGQNRTVYPESPAETPAETPAPNARAGREPGNQKNNYPPNPPDGGSRTESVTIVEDFLTDRGRKRQRTVVVELDAIREQLRAASDGDLADWERIRDELKRRVGESTFEIWLAQLELAATDPGGRLVLAAPASTRSWVAERFARAFDRAGVVVDRTVRLADERELRLLAALATSPSPAAAPAPDVLPRLPHPIPHKEAV
jgi:hypothetical protein